LKCCVCACVVMLFYCGCSIREKLNTSKNNILGYPIQQDLKENEKKKTDFWFQITVI